MGWIDYLRHGSVTREDICEAVVLWVGSGWLEAGFPVAGHFVGLYCWSGLRSGKLSVSES